MSRDAAAIRFYRGLLWLYPAEFREHFSHEICLLLANRLRSQAGAARRFAVWLAAAAAILIDAPQEHYHMIRQDIVYALRTMRRDKLTSLTAVIVLALGIGSTATIFRLVNGLLLHPLPFPEQERLVYVEEASGKKGGVSGAVAFPNYLDFCSRNISLEAFALYGSGMITLREQGADAERIPGGSASGTLFRVLGVQPLIGRTFTEQDDQPKAAPVVLLSENFWRRRFGGNTGILEQKIDLGGESTQVIGVMPRGFHFPDNAELWTPLRLELANNTRTDHGLEGIARLGRGISPAQAQSDLRAIMQQISREHPTETYGQTVDVRPFSSQTTSNVRPVLLTLLGAVGFVLLIACANISSLLLVKATSRRREVAVRGALGASRSRLVRQFAVESVLLSAGGAFGGLLMAWAAVPALLRLAPAGTLPIWADYSTDPRTWLFIALLTAGTGLVVAVLPAFSASRQNLVEALKDGSRSSTGGAAGNRVRACLVVAEVAMSVVLLTGAGLTIRTFLNLQRQNTGFRVENITTLQIASPAKRYPTGPEAEQLVGRALREFASLPGVESVAAASGVPIVDGWGRSLTVEGAPLLNLRNAPMINHTVVTPGYFKTLGIPLLEGRDFSAADGGGLLVTIIDAGIARQYWPRESAIGKRVRFGPPENNEPWHTVVGVVGPARNQTVRELRRNSVYLPYGEFGWANVAFLVRTSAGLGDPGPALRRRMSEIDRNVAVSRVVTLQNIVGNSTWRERFFATLFAFFAGLALAMALVGLYGVMAYAVSRRTHELGIRMALGASAGEIRLMVMLQSSRLVAAGLALGIGAAVMLARLIGNQLYGVQPGDPATFVSVSALLAGAALLASYLPARRATRVDPMLALRAE